MNINADRKFYILSVLALLLLGFSQTLFAAGGCDGSGNCYIYPLAPGTGTGANWTNACTGFSGTCKPSSMTRGVTYWIAAGNYGAPTFSTPDSGTSVITIEVATVSNHGPAADWNNSFAGQAVFTGGSITTDYWTLNGQAWPCSGAVVACGTTGYNLRINNTTNGSQAFNLAGGSYTSPQSNITMEYFELTGIQNGTSDDGGLNISCANNNVYVGYAYIHDVGVDLVQAQYTCTGQNYTGVSWIFEHDFFAHNHRGDAAAHAQAIATGAQNLWVRYNIFHDIGSSGCITDPFPGDITTQNWAIYGNVFEWDSSFTAGVGDGLVGLFGEAMNGYFYVVNNTIAYINNPVCATGTCTSPALFLCGSTCGSSGNPSPAIVENNLWWNPSYAEGLVLDSSSSWTPTHDYNQAYCPVGGCSYPGGGGFITQGTHDLQSSTGNPFLNFDGSTNFNVSLSSNTSAGTTISGWSSIPSGCTAGANCMDVDGLGVTRGANGTIDRGAFQITTSTPNAPANLTATPH